MFTKYSKIAFKGLTVISVSLDKYKFKVEPTASELGTGALYTNNFDCPLAVSAGQLWYKNDVEWSFDFDLNLE